MSPPRSNYHIKLYPGLYKRDSSTVSSAGLLAVCSGPEFFAKSGMLSRLLRFGLGRQSIAEIVDGQLRNDETEAHR
jgi:hypothetical protein